MFYYKFAKVYLAINYNMVDFQPFAISEKDVDINDCITVEFSDTKCQNQNGHKIFSNNFINIYRIEENNFAGWIIEDILERGFLLASSDYKKIVYSTTYSRTNSGYYEVLKFLLLFIIQYRMVYVGLLILHAACINVNGKALCFSGPSGIGKSTRARLWTEHQKATWISGDRPAIDPVNGIAYGTPWDGKEQIHLNVHSPITALLEINRSEDTYLEELTSIQKYQFLSSQLFIPMWDFKLTAKVFTGMKQLMNNVKIYRLHCDKTEKSRNEVFHLLFNE